MTETITNKKFKFDDRITGRGALRFIPNDRWEINWRADFVKDDGTGSLASSIAPQFNTDDDIYTATLNITPDNSLDVWGTSVDLFRQGNNVDFVSITGYRFPSLDTVPLTWQTSMVTPMVRRFRCWKV